MSPGPKREKAAQLKGGALEGIEVLPGSSFSFLFQAGKGFTIFVKVRRGEGVGCIDE
jgi:hypothetical protein